MLIVGLKIKLVAKLLRLGLVGILSREKYWIPYVF
jgi:hypothetical protein